MNNLVRKVNKIVKSPASVLIWLNKNTFLRLPSKAYLSVLYKKEIGNKINWKKPMTFNEKLQWLKIYDRNPEYSRMVDKAEAKDFFVEYLKKEGIGNPEQYIIPTLAIYDKFDDIDFDKLPKQFVIKCTHDSGGIVICKDKEKFLSNSQKFQEARDKINSLLRKNYFWYGREWPYKNVKPRVIVEEYMQNDGEDELSDYKFMCFNGKVKFILMCTERYSDGLKVTFFDREWEKMPFGRRYHPTSGKNIRKPKNFDEMIKLAEILSRGVPFVRVDFYEVNGKIFFGELTFYPGSGLEEFSPEIWDKKLGDMIDLPGENKK